MYDVTKMISTLKGKRGDHRIFRLAENLCMNLILSLRDFFSVKREGKVGIFLQLNFCECSVTQIITFSELLNAFAGSN